MLFRKLFNFRSDEMQQAERRLASRYTVLPTFPLTVSVASDLGDSAASIVDLSGGGAGLMLKKPLALETGAGVRLKFMLENEPFVARAAVRHIRQAEGGLLCGFSISMEDLEGRKAFLQLLVPVSIGSSLKRVTLSHAPIAEPGLERVLFEGDSNSRLIVWNRTEDGGGPDSFEFQVGDYFVRGRAADRKVRAYSLVDDERPHRAKDTAPLFSTDNVLENEIGRLFRWSVLNLQDGVPEETRGFLRSFFG